MMSVLHALDANHDLVLSPGELAVAPSVLRRLDSSHKGHLDAEECGFFMPSNVTLPPGFLARARRSFMREKPVLAALDADHDGEISAAEMANSASTLQAL